jgi:DNA-directed RNA polymerase specialized sigma24 family protein
MPDLTAEKETGLDMDSYSDDILEALNRLKPIYREALLLQQAGYRLNEIMEISFRNGNLKTRNIETVKSRLFLAKQQMRRLIDRNGERRKD